MSGKCHLVFLYKCQFNLAFSAFFKLALRIKLLPHCSVRRTFYHHQLERYGGVWHPSERRVNRGGCVPAISQQGPCEFAQHSLVRKLVGALTEQISHTQRQHDIFWSYRRSQQREHFPASHQKNLIRGWEPWRFLLVWDAHKILAWKWGRLLSSYHEDL